MAIKLKVTLWYTLLMAALCAFTLIVINRHVVRTEREALKYALNQAVTLAVNNVEYEDGTYEIDDDDDIALIYPEVSLYLYDARGELLFGRRERLVSPFDGGGIREEIINGDQALIVLDAQVSDGMYVRGVAAKPRAGGAASLRDISFIALPLFVLLGGAGGYMLTRRAFRPVKRITDAASRITNSRDFSLRIAANGPDDELRALADAIDRMLEALEKAYEAERRLTADAAHELRTPLAGILAQCENALAAKDDALKTQALNRILESGRAMSALISKLLMLARIEAGAQSLEREETDLSALAQACAQQAIAEYAGMSVITQIAPDARVIGDQSLIMRLMLNLLGNAARYRRAGTDVHVTLEREAKSIVFSVSNEGEGIPEDALPHIFDRFYRADPSRAGESAGLGLAIVKAIAELHGARVGVKSEAGKGAVFSVYFPETKNN